MKAVILAGGLGTRLCEETAIRPKPMVEIGGYPILWHILKMYSHHGSLVSVGRYELDVLVGAAAGELDEHATTVSESCDCQKYKYK